MTQTGATVIPYQITTYPDISTIRILRILIALLVLWGLSLSESQAQDRGQHLRVGFNNVESYPYFLGTGASLSSPPGISIEIINQAAEVLGFSVDYLRMPGQRVLQELKKGNLDAAFIFSHKQDRLQYGRYPTTNGLIDRDYRMASLSYMLYRPIGSKLDWDGEYFHNLSGKLAANLNYSIVNELRALGVSVTDAKSTPYIFRMLAAKRVAGVVDQETVADSHLNQLTNAPFEKVTIPIARKDYYLLFSHQFLDINPKKADEIWKFIADYRDLIIRDKLPIYKALRNSRIKQ